MAGWVIRTVSYDKAGWPTASYLSEISFTNGMGEVWSDGLDRAPVYRTKREAEQAARGLLGRGWRTRGVEVVPVAQAANDEKAYRLEREGG